ncbi:DUF5115 domain-containing protein [uncultured Muribaculum sp.]|jgi:hypothetical protein|uniref:Outer membrane protein SusF domain-containing protein n=1 Tax=uncultured Muribaculum sp. TaxID=1918613 RepID=UPI00259C839B|nr:DUF5115 domain-containing protein [uncultured Muribaculum sp.]
MKLKLNIALFAAFALGLAACSDDVYRGIPQVTPQEPVMPADGIEATDVLPDGGAIDLSSAETFSMVNITKLEDFPATDDLSVVMRVSESADMSNPEAMVLNVADDNKTASVASVKLNEVFRKMFGKSPKARTIYVDYTAYAVNGSSSVLLGAIGAKQSLVVTPLPADFVIEDNYYLVGTACDWKIPQAIAFTHSDKSPYDDPVFKLINIEVTAEQAAAGWWWKIIPASTFEAGDWVPGDNTQYGPATNGDEAMEGKLVGVDAQAGVIKVAGHYDITINMEDLTYTISKTPAVMYVPNQFGWNEHGILYSTDYENFQGLAGIDPIYGFKFMTGDGQWIGAGKTEGTLSTSGGNILEGVLTKVGLYYLTVNMPDMTFTQEYISSLALIGSATPNGWSEADAVEMTPNEDYEIWTLDVHLVPGSFKFMTDHSWAKPNLGGDVNNLTFGGGDLNFEGEEGDYTVTLDLSKYPYSCTVVKK